MRLRAVASAGRASAPEPTDERPQPIFLDEVLTSQDPAETLRQQVSRIVRLAVDHQLSHACLIQAARQEYVVLAEPLPKRPILYIDAYR